MVLAHVSGLHRFQSQPHKRFSSEKAWFRKALSSSDHTAILEKCIFPAARTCGLRRSRPGFSVTIAGGVIPQQQDRVLELIVSL
jgi:hypothetical protein